METFIPIMTAGYSPGEAERRKFCMLDQSTITGYLTSWGNRYATLVKLVEPISIAGDSTTIAVSGTFTADQADTTYIASTSLDVGNVYVISAPTSKPFTFVEVRNATNSTVYFLATSSTTFTALTAKGMIIGVQGYYSITRSFNSFCIGTNGSGVDTRIFCHYKV